MSCSWKRGPEVLGQRGFEGFMEIVHLFPAQTAADIGIDGVTLDGAGTDQSHLDNDVVEDLRAQRGRVAI